jgi:hypothetical protein
VFTSEGRAATWFSNSCAALWAALQCPLSTAEEMASSCELSVLDWPEESSPLWPPQATTNATAKPRLPARAAREP